MPLSPMTYGLCVAALTPALLGLNGCDDDAGQTNPDPRDAALVVDAAGGRLEDAAVAPPWRVVEGPIEPIVLSAWGPSAETVFFAGGQSGADGGFVARLQGGRIAVETTPAGRPLWWVFGLDQDHVWAVGEEGRILRKRDGNWQRETTDLDSKAHLWGGFALSPDDVWAVGGSVRRGGPKGLVLRQTAGAAWSVLTDPALPTETNLFKVWGAAPDDVHFVGEAGVALHWDGAALRRVDTPTPDLLFTVHGRAGGPVLAVGGTVVGVALRWTGDTWVDDAPPEGPPLNGVFVRPDGTALASGANGVLLERDVGGTWRRVRLPEAQPYTLHAVFSNGSDWTVGGDLTSGVGGFIATTASMAPVFDGRTSPQDAGMNPDALPPVDAAPVPADAAVPPADVAPPRDVPPSPGDGAPPDAGPVDAGPVDAAPPVDGPQVVDAALPPVPDAAPPIPDAAPVPDAAPLPGPAASCELSQFLCQPGLDCYDVFAPNVPRVTLCLRPCETPDTCDPEFGVAPCCTPPGPQLLDRYCVPSAFYGGQCP
jgi:hypothetical protein